MNEWRFLSFVLRKQSEQGKKRRLEKYKYVGRNEREKYEETPRFPWSAGGYLKMVLGNYEKVAGTLRNLR